MSARPASYRRLWVLFAFVVLASFAVLGGFGFRIASEAPPVPAKVVAGDKVLFDGDLIRHVTPPGDPRRFTRSIQQMATALLDQD